MKEIKQAIETLGGVRQTHPLHANIQAIMRVLQSLDTMSEHIEVVDSKTHDTQPLV